MLLELEGITVHYGKSLAIQEISLKVAEGTIVSIIGANGSGKSTILRALAGLTPLTSGEIRFQGRKITGMTTTDIVRQGIVLVPEGRQLFPFLSVLSNLRLGATLRKDKEGMERDLEAVYHLFPRLRERSAQKAGTLSGGEQQMLAIGRGLMANPTLLCMDEPSLGLAPIVIDQLGEVIKDINKRGVSVLLVEQNAQMALSVADRGYVLETGSIVAEGLPSELLNTEEIRAAYLGGRAKAQ